MDSRNGLLVTLAALVALVGGATWVATPTGQNESQRQPDGLAASTEEPTSPPTAQFEPGGEADWLGQAKDAQEGGRIDEAVHLYQLEIRQGGSSRHRALEALEEVRRHQVTEATSRNDFDTAARHLRLWRQLLLDVVNADANSGFLGKRERDYVFAAKARHQATLEDHQRNRQRFFESKVRETIRRVEEAFARVKRPWYWNDDEAHFQDALFELNRAWQLEAELGEDVRGLLADLHARLKSELSRRQYEETMEKSRIVLHDPSDASNLTKGTR